MPYLVYATQDDLKAYLEVEALPIIVTDRLLRRASELIKTFTRNNIITTNTKHLEAAKLASCAQIEYWLEMQESFAIQPDVKGFGSGDIKVDFARIPDQLAKRARSYLNEEALLYRGIGGGAVYENDLSNLS